MNDDHPRHYQNMLLGYIAGFVFSIILTLEAYLLVVNHTFSHHILIGVVAGLAVVQIVLQLLFFLHLGSETKPRWRLLVFCFMSLVVGILVIGSLWIMGNLNYRMTPQQVTQYLNDQGGGF